MNKEVKSLNAENRCVSEVVSYNGDGTRYPRCGGLIPDHSSPRGCLFDMSEQLPAAFYSFTYYQS